MSEIGDNELDPRIQIELEKLNTTTDEINKLEIEYDEANTTFRLLLNESTRRLKLLSKKLGSCIDRARPYYEALEVAKLAQQECQKAAVQFQRANEIHAAAKETVALAEQRFLSNQHEWQFDNAWQEMLNHATIKVCLIMYDWERKKRGQNVTLDTSQVLQKCMETVMEAENQKAESGREHQRRATIFKSAEENAKQLEAKLQKSIIKSRPYFDEKSLCHDQLNAQKDRVEAVKRDIIKAKTLYSQTLKQLEQISNEIHMKRGNLNEEILRGPREPGVGAELAPSHDELTNHKHAALPDFHLELEKCEVRSVGSISGTNSSAVSEKDDKEDLEDLDDLKSKFKELAVRPVYGGEGESMDGVWENELKDTVDKLDHMMMLQECAKELDNYKAEINTLDKSVSADKVLDC